MAKITIENMENLIKVEVFFHLLRLPICWRQKQANLPIAGGKGNYRQNGMYIAFSNFLENFVQYVSYLNFWSKDCEIFRLLWQRQFPCQ